MKDLQEMVINNTDTFHETADHEKRKKLIDEGFKELAEIYKLQMPAAGT